MDLQETCPTEGHNQAPALKQCQPSARSNLLLASQAQQPSSFPSSPKISKQVQKWQGTCSDHQWSKRSPTLPPRPVTSLPPSQEQQQEAEEYQGHCHGYRRWTKRWDVRSPPLEGAQKRLAFLHDSQLLPGHQLGAVELVFMENWQLSFLLSCRWHEAISDLGQQHQARGSTPILHQPAKQVANFPETHHPTGISRVLKWGWSLHPNLVRPGSFLNRTTQPPAQSCCCSEHPRSHQALGAGSKQQTPNSTQKPEALKKAMQEGDLEQSIPLSPSHSHQRLTPASAPHFPSGC